MDFERGYFLILVPLDTIKFLHTTVILHAEKIRASMSIAHLGFRSAPNDKFGSIICTIGLNVWSVFFEETISVVAVVLNFRPTQVYSSMICTSFGLNM